MWSGTVVRHGGRAMRAQAAQVTGDPLAAVEDLDGSGGDACLNLLTQPRMRHAVPVLGDLDVIVEADGTASSRRIRRRLVAAPAGRAGRVGEVGDCQEFRVRAGIVAKKETCHGPTQTACY